MSVSVSTPRPYSRNVGILLRRGRDLTSKGEEMEERGGGKGGGGDPPKVKVSKMNTGSPSCSSNCRPICLLARIPGVVSLLLAVYDPLHVWHGRHAVCLLLEASSASI